MSDGPQRSGIPAWLVVGAAIAWLGRSRRRTKDEQARAQADADRYMRRVVLEDGQEALQAEVVLSEPDAASLGRWQLVRVEGVGANQSHLGVTLAQPPASRGEGPIDVRGPAGETFDLAAVLVPLGTRRRVNAVDCYVTGGLAGHLPAAAVSRWGDQLRTVLRARGGQPSAVPARIVREGGPGGEGLLQLDVLMPDTFPAA
jgi:hypothetical protein